MLGTDLLARLLRKFIEFNFRISRWESAKLATISRRDGTFEFCTHVVPSLLRPGLRVLDVGGGRAPMISPAKVQELGLQVVGLDISADELRAAPPGAYSETIVGDVSSVSIPGAFDLILSRAVLEHVRDTGRAIANLATALSAGGTMTHFIPCRNALFAWLNRMLGNALARRILFAIYPERRESSGFPAYYDRCTPSQLERVCKECGLETVTVEPYFVSVYFECFAPLHTLDLCRQLMLQRLRARNFAETMILVASKPAAASARVPYAA